jgi:hypothetical protein
MGEGVPINRVHGRGFAVEHLSESKRDKSKDI